MPKMFKSRYKLRHITVTGNDPLFPIDVVDCALGDFMGTRQGGAEGMLLTFPYTHGSRGGIYAGDWMVLVVLSGGHVDLCIPRTYASVGFSADYALLVLACEPGFGRQYELYRRWSVHILRDPGNEASKGVP